MTPPPPWIIELAVQQARLSPCAKSKRGAAVWRKGYVDADRSQIVHLGFNGPPAPFTCDGSAECRATCNRRCAHAESRAIMSAIEYEHARGAEMLHVKIDTSGKLVAGGGPSCWQCSRDALEARIAVVWLYEERAIGPQWRQYTAEEFHRVTCANAKGGPVYVGPTVNDVPRGTDGR